MKKSFNILNELLVETFNDILKIEQNTLKTGVFNDLSITEVHTIDAIGMYSALAMSEVANKLEITVGTLTTAVNNLVRKGYVERQRDENDRRVVKVALTRKGKLVYRVHEKFHSDMVKATIEGLDEDEERVLINSLQKLNKFFQNKYRVNLDK